MQEHTTPDDSGKLRGVYNRHGKQALTGGFVDGDRVVLHYESPYSGSTVEVTGTASDVHITSFTLTLDDGREWGVLGSSIRTTIDNRRQSGRVKAKNGRPVGFVDEMHVYAPEQ